MLGYEEAGEIVGPQVALETVHCAVRFHGEVNGVDDENVELLEILHKLFTKLLYRTGGGDV